MTKEEIRELASLHALDLLEGSEKQRFEAELRSNPEAARVLEEYQTTVDLVSLSAEPRVPSAEVEERIFSNLPPQLGEAPTDSQALEDLNSDESGSSKQPNRFTTWIPLGLAAAFAISCTVLWLDLSEEQDQVAQLEADLETHSEDLAEHQVRIDFLDTKIADQEELIGELNGQIESRNEQIASQTEQIASQQTELQSNQTQLEEQATRISEQDALLATQQDELQHHLDQLSQRDSEILALEQQGALDRLRIAVLKSQLEDMPNAQAVAVWDDDAQEGRLAVSNLPSVPPGKDYQLWLINADIGTPVSAGVFNTDNGGSIQFSFATASALERVDTFALSVEDDGGKPSPEGPIVLAGE